MSQIAELTNINKQSAERSAKNRTPDAAQRAQHPKHHGCVEASFEVLDNISTDLRIGLFAKPLKYETLVRFSNGRQSDDREPDAHGMAIKVLGVGGPKMIEGREHEEAQDFVLIDNETFFTGDPSLYLESNKALLGNHGKLVGIAEVVAKSIFRDPHLALRIKEFASKTPTSPLSCIYFSTTPYRLGEHRVVKYIAEPRELQKPSELIGKNGLAYALAKTLKETKVVFRFGVDVQTDANAQPIEDPTIPWSKIPGARREWLADIVIKQQRLKRPDPYAENLAFSPWHTLKEHEPLGYINFARGQVYRELAIERHKLNEIVPLESSEKPDTYEQHPQQI